jgi:hypothetical protein
MLIVVLLRLRQIALWFDGWVIAGYADRRSVMATADRILGLMLDDCWLC